MLVDIVAILQTDKLAEPCLNKLFTSNYNNEKSPSVCDGRGCSNKATEIIKVPYDYLGIISWKLCKDCSLKFSQKKGANFEHLVTDE